MKINKSWHKSHRMEKNASFIQRVNWHKDHKRECYCRPVPPKLLEEMRKRNINSQRKILIARILQRQKMTTRLREETLVKIKRYFTGSQIRINSLKKSTKVKNLRIINISKQIFNVIKSKMMNHTQT